MKNTYRLYGWHLSYFSGKARAYLRYKGIPFDDVAVNAWTLLKRFPKKTGATAMPVVVTPEGEWLQDTTAIIEQLERRHPELPVMPDTPVQQMAAMLIELWADEYWIPPAMHYRWSYPENERLFLTEAGRALLPWAPAFIGRRVAQRSARLLKSYLPGVGVTPAQQPIMEAWTEAMLNALEAHFTRHDYLLGGRPTLADFALAGPLYAHLGRDPWPKRELIAPRPKLAAWIARAHGGEAGSGALLADDALPETLAPVVASVFRELLPMLEGIRDQVAAYAERPPTERGRLPRMMEAVRFPMGETSFERGAMPYALWMMQRVQAAYRSLDDTARGQVDAWLASQGAADALSRDWGPPLQRKGLRAELA